MYIDNIKIFSEVASDDDIFKIQNDLNNIANWAACNGLSFNLEESVFKMN